MPAEQYHEFPLAPRERTWDKTSAITRCRKWASSDGSGDKDKMDWPKYRKVFFWHEAGTLSDFGQFKFPYCDIIDGGPHVVHNAVQNALARIDGSNIPEEDKPKVRNVAQRQMDRFNDENESAEGIFGQRSGTFGKPTPIQLEKINKLAKRPLREEEVFVWTHKMAGDMIIPERYIQLTVPLLEQFVKNANAGVAFLLNHSWTWTSPKPALPYGRVFEGELSKKGIVKGETISFNGSTYIVRGQEKDGIKTDSIISDIETGVLFDTSIGWGANKFICSICGNDIRDWRKCEHLPGKTYVVNEETGETKLCWAMAMPPGYLMEDSGVFDGAYPGAGTSLGIIGADGYENKHGVFASFDDFKQIPPNICVYGTYSTNGGILTFIKKADYIKVHSLSGTGGSNLKGEFLDKPEDGTDLAKTHDMYHEMYAKKELPTGWTMKDLSQKHTEAVERLILHQKHYLDDALDGNLPGHLKAKSLRREENKLDALIAEIFSKAKIDPAQIEKATEQGFVMKDGTQYYFSTANESTAENEELAALKAKVAQLELLAKDGEQFRKEVIDEALAAGVRAQGNDFPADTWKNTFSTMTIQAIRDIAKTFQKQAEAEIPAGRMTIPAGLSKKTILTIPDEAYGA